MLKLTKTGIGLLTRQYRSVLHKCWLINVGLWQAMGDAVSKAVSVPARLVASLLSGGALNGEAFNVLDEILLNRLFERKLASLTAIGLTVAAATMPSEAEAGVLCYDYSTGTVKYSTTANCPAGTTSRLMSLDGINSSATIGGNSVALGYNAQATNYNAVALGYGAQANGERSAALGYNAQATKTYAAALGPEAKANGENSVALGNNAKATGEGSTAIGYNSIADEANTVSFGKFGADSATLTQMQYDLDHEMTKTEFKTKYAQYTSAGDLYMYYIQARMSWEQSVEMAKIKGEFHRITNVADGTGDHDAVTYGQVKSNIKGLSVSGKVITYTKVDGTTGTITTQDTTYSAGTGIGISGSNNAIRVKLNSTYLTTDANGNLKALYADSAGSVAWSNVSGRPTALSAFTNDSGYITKAVNDLTYYTKTSDLATVATSGSYSDLTGTPTIGEALLRITSGGTETSFSANATADVTLNLDNNYYKKLLEKDEILDESREIEKVMDSEMERNSSEKKIIKGMSAFPSILCTYPFDMPHAANDNDKNVITRLDRVISANDNDSAEILVSSTRMTGKESIKMTGNATTTKQAA